jgi:uncharacterized protein YxeA
MAEIKIEKKKPIMVWIIIGIILLAIGIYFLVYDNSENQYLDDSQNTEKTEDNQSDLIGINENNTTVTEYVNFIESDQNKMGLDHEFTNEAIVKLTAAIFAMAEEVDVDVDSELKKMEDDAEDITIDPYVTTHANSIRNAADNMTNALQKIQKSKFPGLSNEVNDLRNSANAIDTDVLTLDQRNEVKSYFYNASHLLKKMN